ncbi:hypothetical protein ACFL5O_04670 [Myxococcota bacterium]
MIDVAGRAGVPTAWDRARAQHPHCRFATDGVCCRLCHMGPCRITPKTKLGICGADADTITARNLPCRPASRTRHTTPVAQA